MTKQEIFDTVLHALRKQGRASVKTHPEDGIPTDMCVYRAANGDKCAAGHLIPDDLYDPKMEDKTFIYVSKSFGTGCALGMDSSDVEFVGLLQNAHDDYLTKGLEHWELQMESVAARYSLTYTPPATALAWRACWRAPRSWLRSWWRRSGWRRRAGRGTGTPRC